MDELLAAKKSVAQSEGKKSTGDQLSKTQEK
jgi:hypothetical protein